MLAFFKVALISIVAVGNNYGFKPPRLPPSLTDNRVIYRGQIFEQIVYIWAIQTRVLFSLKNVCPHPTATLPLLGTPTPSLALAVSCVLAGCLLRSWCYSTLGEFFTFNVGVFKSQPLITRGPYAYVRHPSYSALYLLFLSTGWVYFGTPGNYISACGILQTPYRFILYYHWAFAVPMACLALYRRGTVEDKLLREQFGPEWNVYRRNVPYKFIPYFL
ncbi:hypothetical protein C8R45DRAFT_835322 [Mycena sanguinolenta]|nr:hypothetical protein C8R45DRAFT_835322 [Mycena sanguinolenta]